MGDGYYGFNICPNIPSFMSGKTQVEIFLDNHKVADGTITPTYEDTMIRFAADIEDRLDALLAIYKERTDREIAELTRQIRS